MRAARSAAPPGAGCHLCCLLPAHLPRALPAHSAGLSGEGTTEQKFITLPDPRTGRHPTVLNTPIMLPRQPAPCLVSQLPPCPPCRTPCRPAPGAGQPSSYLLAGGCLQEINWFKQQYSSWLIADRVAQGECEPEGLWGS